MLEFVYVRFDVSTWAVSDAEIMSLLTTCFDDATFAFSNVLNDNVN